MRHYLIYYLLKDLKTDTLQYEGELFKFLKKGPKKCPYI